MKRLSTILIAVLLSACGDDAVSFSAPIAINLKVESGDVKAASALSNEKGITTESSNPWAKFVTDARAKLGGMDPSDVNLTSAELLLAGTSTGVTGFEEVFVGDVVVQFVMETSNNVIPVAKVSNPSGRGPVAMNVQFDYASVPPQDLPKFYTGSYKVVLAGMAAPTFAAKGAKADVQLTLRFEAFE